MKAGVSNRPAGSKAVKKSPPIPDPKLAAFWQEKKIDALQRQGMKFQSLQMLCIFKDNIDPEARKVIFKNADCKKVENKDYGGDVERRTTNAANKVSSLLGLLEVSMFDEYPLSRFPLGKGDDLYQPLEALSHVASPDYFEYLGIKKKNYLQVVDQGADAYNKIIGDEKIARLLSTPSGSAALSTNISPESTSALIDDDIDQLEEKDSYSRLAAGVALKNIYASNQEVLDGSIYIGADGEEELEPLSVNLVDRSLFDDIRKAGIDPAYAERIAINFVADRFDGHIDSRKSQKNLYEQEKNNWDGWVKNNAPDAEKARQIVASYNSSATCRPFVFESLDESETPDENGCRAFYKSKTFADQYLEYRPSAESHVDIYTYLLSPLYRQNYENAVNDEVRKLVFADFNEAEAALDRRLDDLAGRKAELIESIANAYDQSGPVEKTKASVD